MKYLIAALASMFLIPIPSWGDVSLIEAIWTAVGMVALFASLWSMPKVVVDFVVAKHAPSGKMAEARVMLARGHIRRECIRLAQGAIILLIGLYADFQPQPYSKITLVGLFLTLGVVALAALVAVQSLLDRRQRDAAERVLAEEA